MRRSLFQKLLATFIPPFFFIFLLILPVANFHASRKELQRERKIQLGLEHDPNLQYQCRGALGEFAACLCNDEAKDVACINAQFVDTAIFQYLIGHYENLEQLTFHGNNFQDLPDASIFGPSNRLDRLRVLNISANYIVNLHGNALSGCPNIEVLDLSNNEIVLSEENVHFLSHVPRLKKLYLRRAFTTPLNRSDQFRLMMRMFELAKLNMLEYLDLSYNYFSSVPLNLACPFPFLRHLDLRQNILTGLSLNASCLTQIGRINLERNYFHSLDQSFRTFGDDLHAKNRLARIQIRNSFFCDCASSQWIQWIRGHSQMIGDYRTLSCSRASPQRFIGARISEVPIGQLDCEFDLYTSAGVIIKFQSTIFFPFFLIQIVTIFLPLFLQLIPIF